MQDNLPALSDFFVAEEKSEVVGCCAIVVYSPKIAEVRSLAVRKDFRGKGIATRLINVCVKKARARNVREILSITGALPLFDKVGFKTFNREKYALFKILR